MFPSNDIATIMPSGFKMNRGARQAAIERAREAGELPSYMTRQEYEDILRRYGEVEGMAAGGIVHAPRNWRRMELGGTIGYLADE